MDSKARNVSKPRCVTRRQVKRIGKESYSLLPHIFLVVQNSNFWNVWEPSLRFHASCCQFPPRLQQAVQQVNWSLARSLFAFDSSFLRQLYHCAIGETVSTCYFTNLLFPSAVVDKSGFSDATIGFSDATTGFSVPSIGLSDATVGFVVSPTEGKYTHYTCMHAKRWRTTYQKYALPRC